MTVQAPNSGVVPANEINNVLVTIQERFTKSEAAHAEAIAELEDQIAQYRAEESEIQKRHNGIVDALLLIIQSYGDRIEELTR